MRVKQKGKKIAVIVAFVGISYLLSGCTITLPATSALSDTFNGTPAVANPSSAIPNFIGPGAACFVLPIPSGCTVDGLHTDADVFQYQGQARLLERYPINRPVPTGGSDIDFGIALIVAGVNPTNGCTTSQLASVSCFAGQPAQLVVEPQQSCPILPSGDPLYRATPASPSDQFSYTTSTSAQALGELAYSSPVAVGYTQMGLSAIDQSPQGFDFGDTNCTGFGTPTPSDYARGGWGIFAPSVIVDPTDPARISMVYEGSPYNAGCVGLSTCNGQPGVGASCYVGSPVAQAECGNNIDPVTGQYDNDFIGMADSTDGGYTWTNFRRLMDYPLINPNENLSQNLGLSVPTIHVDANPNPSSCASNSTTTTGVCDVVDGIVVTFELYNGVNGNGNRGDGFYVMTSYEWDTAVPSDMVEPGCAINNQSVTGDPCDISSVQTPVTPDANWATLIRTAPAGPLIDTEFQGGPGRLEYAAESTDPNNVYMVFEATTDTAWACNLGDRIQVLLAQSTRGIRGTPDPSIPGTFDYIVNNNNQFPLTSSGGCGYGPDMPSFYWDGNSFHVISTNRLDTTPGLPVTETGILSLYDFGLS